MIPTLKWYYLIRCTCRIVAKRFAASVAAYGSGRGASCHRPGYQPSTNDGHPVLVLDRSGLAMITDRYSVKVRTSSFVLTPYNFSGRNRYLDWVRSRISSPLLGAYFKGPSRVVSLVVMSYDVAEGTG
ncbi:hypothetical protein PIB30_025409 [Stylosanthes scabra]|uniref:Uncharacterized protein n=1 Tax=Stylosanthes scabra TaxID=79078 RepID=A0ABU6RAB9_9FABA|nr:hypothetical protein [Stylosanthes scabra]